MKVTKENYIVIQGFMRTELNLKGNELILYALIYGFSQAEKQAFTGSLQYMSDFLGVSKQAIQDLLKKLLSKGFLEKKDNIVNGVKFVEYRTRGIQETCIPYKNVVGGIQETCIGGIQETCTNNNILNNNNDINNKRNICKEKELPFGQFKRIKLTQTQYEKLIDEFGETKINDMILKLDEYLELNNNKNKYTNFNLVIRKAIRENWFTASSKTQAKSKNEPDWLEKSRQKIFASVEVIDEQN